MNLKETLSQLPKSPGVYQYFDTKGRLLYIGKAKNLSARVKSYWNFTPKLHPNPTLSLRIQKMLNETGSLEYIVVKSEHDALILENSLIKQLKPKYNILLRDDKTYPYLYIDLSLPYPRVELTRKVVAKHKELLYFGPYSVGARDILDSVYELTRLVQKKSCLTSKKLCLYYQLQRCLGPCELDISKERYSQELSLAIEFIKNKQLLIEKLQEKMEIYAEDLRFEEAAQLRDRIDKIKRSQLNSNIDLASNDNYDIFASAANDKRGVIVKIFMRNGKIISSDHTFFSLRNDLDPNEIYTQMLLDFYTTKPPLVAPILLDADFDDREWMQHYLSDLFGKKASLLIPKKGKKKELIELAKLNANELLKKELKNTDHTLLEELQTLFELQNTPERVEIFDNSHLFGVATVGAMVVYDNGVFDKKSYRHYHLHVKDEYAQMKEILSRRVASFEKNPPPDLWILDGGATLLQLALDILESAGVTLDVIAIAKEKVDAKAHRAKGKAKDIIYTSKDMFKLKESDKRLQWVQKLRDEAHKSAIGFHKKIKLKLDQESKLLNLHGISQAKITKLLNYFGTFENIKKASFEALSDILNQKDAKNIKNFYN